MIVMFHKKKRVIIDKRNCQFDVNSKIALSKARYDVEKTFESLGGRVVNISWRQNGRFIIYRLFNFIQYIKSIFLLPINGYVYIQYPALFSRLDFYDNIINIARFFGNKVIYLVHDVEMLRYTPERDIIEIEVLNKSDAIIVHSPAMQDILQIKGVKSRMIIINLFDYYVNETCNRTSIDTKLRNVVAFAGNLYKSEFIGILKNTKINEKLYYRFYGQSINLTFSDNPQMQYCGSFQADQINILEAGWGLVWDGNDLDYCAGVTGEYLRYNAPHKLSLYIAAGLPLIVWKESAAADFVKKEHIGICITSLNDIYDEITKLSDEEYLKIKENVNRLSLLLRNGTILKSVISEIER